MKKFLVTTTSGQITIKADGVTFEPGHVCFWVKMLEKNANGTWNEQETLVRAIHNPAVEAVEEIREPGRKWD